MKTILFILPNLNQGGAEKVITTLANELDRNLFQPKILLFEKKGYFLNYLKDDVDIIELKIRRIRYSIFKIITIIWKMKPDIVFVGWGEIAAFLSPLIPFFKKTKFITRETNVVSQHVQRKEIRFFYRFYNNFHKIIAQSGDMQKDLIESLNIQPEKTVKINNPVDVKFIENQMKTDENLFSGKFKNVVAIGNLTERKGFDLLLEVFKSLKDKPVKLHVLGDGRDREKLAKEKEKLGLKNIEFSGIKENPYPYLYQADLFVLSSRYEGFPNVLLEAGACGTYALANDCPGGIDEIIQSGINGEISDITNADLFAQKIWELANKNYDKEFIQESIESRFSKEIIVKKYNQLLSEL